MYNKMSRVPRHFGLSYDEELKMLKELEKVRKQTREDFLKFKLVQKSKAKQSLLPFSVLSRGFNNYSSQSSESSYPAIAKDKLVTPEQSHDLKKKIQGNKLPFKESRKITSLANRPGRQTFCLKEFYLKNTVNIYQRSKEKPVIASLAGTSKQAILFKQPAPPHKSRYRRVILRRRSPILDFPCASRKSTRKSEPPSLPESYRTEEIISKEPMTSEQEAEKISLRKKRWVGPRKEGISYSFLTEKKRKQSLISSVVVDVQMQEEPEIEVLTIEKEEPQEEEPEKKIPSTPVSMKDVPRSIEEIIVSLQSERQSAVDKMIKDLIESVLGQNYDIKMEEVSLITKYQEKNEEAAEATEESEEKESTAELLVPPEKIERMAEDELSSLQTDYDLDVEEPKAEREHVELLQTVLDTKILSELPTLLDTTQNKLPKWIPGPFQVSHLESLKITGKTAIASPRAKPKSQIRRFHAEVSQISKATSKIPHKQSTHTLHKLCIAAPEFVLPTDLQLASRIYHTKDKAGHDTFLRSDKRDSIDDSIRNEKEKNRILYGISTIEPEDKNENICSETSSKLVKWKETNEKPSLHLSGEEVSMYPGSVKMFWVPAPPKFSAPVSLIRQTLYPQYESSCTFKYVVEKQFSESQESLLSKKRDKKLELPKMRVRKSKSFSNFQKITEREAKKSPKRSISALNFTMQRDSILPMIPDDLQSNLNEIMILQEHVLKTMAYETKEDIAADENLNVTEPSHLQNELIQPSEQKDTIHLEPARKIRTSYILFPKRKRRKLRKTLNIEKINSVLKELSKPPKTLERSKSLVILREQKKFFLHVPIYARRSRCPSLPAVLNFNEFAQKHGGIPKNTDPQQWVLDFWVQELQDTLPTKVLEHVEKEIIQIPIEPVKPPEEKKILKIELDDFSNPELSEDDRNHLESEIESLTKEIKEKKKIAALLYCRRGAIYKKLGKLKKAMNDLQEAIFLEPLLLNAYWHRHFIYLFQDRTADALDDLNYITKYNKNNADVYLSKAEIFKKRGNFTLTLLNYTQAIKCRPTDDDIYFKRAEILNIENKLLAMGDYSKCIYFNPERTDALLKRGLYNFESSNWAAAIQDFSTLLKFDYKNVHARTFRGRAFFKKGHYREATEDLSAAIHLDPNNWLAFYCRACLLRKSNQNRSLQDFSVSVLINDTVDNLPAFLHRGILYAEMSRWGLAVADFESVLDLDRSIIFAYINIGIIYLLHMDKYFEAIQKFTEAIQVDPLCIQSYLCRAETYHKIHKLPQAVKDMSRAIHLQPDGIQLYIMRGRYLLEMKRYDLAKSTIFQVARMNKGSLELSPIQQSLVFSFCNQHKEALKILFSVTLCRPEPAIFMLLGKAQMKAKKIQNAVITFKRALDAISPTDKTPKGSFLQAECHYHLGLCYMEEGFFQMAFDSFNKAVKAYPEYAEAFYQRGLCKVKLQKDKSVLDFNRAITIDPKHYQAYISRAAFYGMKGRYSKAILNCNEAIRIFPNSVRAFLYRGVLKFYNKTYKLAIKDLNIAIAMNKACFLAFYNRAICYNKIKEFHLALKDYGIVLLLNVGDDIKAKTLINRGLIYTELKMIANALEDFREAMQINKDDANLFQAAGICHHRMGEFEEAVCSFTRVIELNPFFVDAYVGRGNSYMEYGHEVADKQAQKDFIKALHFNPAYSKTRISLGYNLQAQGKFQKAWNHFTICMDIDPGNCLAYEGRGIICLQMGDNFAAIQDINSALKITISAEFLTNRGVIHEFMGERNIAMKDYQAALSISPEYSLAYFNAGNIYLHHRQFSQASDFYSKALQFDPLNDSAVLNRAITNIILQKFEEAKQDFIRAIYLCPFWAAVYYNKAHLYYCLQQYETAEEDLSKALSLQPNDHLAYKLRADVHGKMGMMEEALKDYNQSLDLQEFAKV
ncbi:tetratricopeptide repeat protein 6 [Sminthopsis crassicaudata]|uniref:tetratricopeptide repeat protein 6 n=1 Tax=Sminthopsis crassicaudata TaxID=9301 RepID=UPI003D69C38A